MERIQQRYAANNRDGPDIVYTDSCCSDSDFLKQIFPSLAGSSTYSALDGQSAVDALLDGR
eukprot:scaffold322675_cov20-Prasinocladus_malaysianus.AAC.1